MGPSQFARFFDHSPVPACNFIHRSFVRFSLASNPLLNTSSILFGSAKLPHLTTCEARRPTFVAFDIQVLWRHNNSID